MKDSTINKNNTNMETITTLKKRIKKAQSWFTSGSLVRRYKAFNEELGLVLFKKKKKLVRHAFCFLPT